MSPITTPLRERMAEPLSEEKVELLWQQISTRRARRERAVERATWAGAGFAAAMLVCALGSFAKGSARFGAAPVLSALVARDPGAAASTPASAGSAISPSGDELVGAPKASAEIVEGRATIERPASQVRTEVAHGGAPLRCMCGGEQDKRALAGSSLTVPAMHMAQGSRGANRAGSGQGPKAVAVAPPSRVMAVTAFLDPGF